MPVHTLLNQMISKIALKRINMIAAHDTFEELTKHKPEKSLLEVKKVRPGQYCDTVGELSYSTANSYLSVIKRIQVQWGTTRITRVKAMKVQEWLRSLDAAPKTKGHIKAVVHCLYEKAMLWEMVEWQWNRMELVEIKVSASAGKDR